MSWHHHGAILVPSQAPKQGVPSEQVSVHLTRMLAGRIAQNITRLREAKGWSRPELGRRCRPATSGSQIERLEKNERRLTVEWIERVAGAFGIDPAELMADEAQQFVLTEQVADEIAHHLARFVLRGDEPDPEIVRGLAILVQGLSETFVRHPQAYHDPQVARLAIDFLTR
jgi:transcriptional regulator with XRE-family HTH domain